MIYFVFIFKTFIYKYIFLRRYLEKAIYELNIFFIIPKIIHNISFERGILNKFYVKYISKFIISDVFTKRYFVAKSQKTCMKTN